MLQRLFCNVSAQTERPTRFELRAFEILGRKDCMSGKVSECAGAARPRRRLICRHICTKHDALSHFKGWLAHAHYALAHDTHATVACVLQSVAVRCSMLQYVAVYCSVLRCVAVCCSVLHRLVRLYCLQLLRETVK